jgi:hypothetical protein
MVVVGRVDTGAAAHDCTFRGNAKLAIATFFAKLRRQCQREIQRVF